MEEDEHSDALGDAGDASSNDADVAIEPPPSYEAFCQQNALQDCQRLSTCCDVPALRLDLCARLMRYRPAELKVASCAPELKEPASFDATSAAACLVARARGYEDCHPVRADQAARRDAALLCAKAAPVPSSTSSRFCDGSWDVCDAPAGMVSDCNECSDGCQPTCGPPRAKGGPGASCEGSEHCKDGLTCRRELGSAPLTCATPAVDGAGCNMHSDCASGECSVAADAAKFWGACAKQPSRIGAQTCETVQALAQNGVLVTSLDRFWVNATELVWLDAGKLRAAPKDGSGTTRTIAEGVYGGELSALDDNQLVLDTRATQGVMNVDLTSGAIREWPLGFRPNALALEHGRLLVASAECGRLVRVSEEGGPDASFVLNVAAPADPDARAAASLLVADDAVHCVTGRAVFVLEQGATAGVLRAQLDANEQAGWYFRASQQSADQLWFSAAGPQGQLQVYTLANGADTLLENSELPVDLRGFFLIDRAEGALYGWAREGVARWSLAQRTLSTLHALLISGRSGFTQDARHLYWYDSPAVMRFPKP